MSSENENYGPLGCLIGVWGGESGKDVSPESDGIEENIYRETLEFNPIGEVVNAESERLMVLKYQQEVFRVRDSKRIHDQLGYWMWNQETDQIIHSFVIPRGVAVIAGGKPVASDGNVLDCRVSASCDDTSWPITQTSFMQANAKTLSFSMRLFVEGERLIYSQMTNLDIYGGGFEHTEESTLTRR